MRYFLFDNSVLTKYRVPEGVVIDSSKMILLKELNAKFNIDFKNIVLTTKLFIELINQGQIRVSIEKNNRDLIDSQKEKVINSLDRDGNHYQSVIDSYIEFLEKLFNNEFEKHFPRHSIETKTRSCLKKYKFIPEFHDLESKIKKHSKNIFKLIHIYKKFILDLVEDSVIRFSLDAINMRRIAEDDRDKAFEIINYTVSSLMVKYYNGDVLNSNLTLLASALKFHLESSKTTRDGIPRLMRVKDDFADVELAYYAFYGIKVDGVLTPVTIFTSEPEAIVFERLKYCFQSIGTKAHNIKSQPQTLVLGSTINLDFNSYTYLEIDSQKYIQNTFKHANGDPIC